MQSEIRKKRVYTLRMEWNITVFKLHKKHPGFAGLGPE
jgi:hypothetical protein